MNLMLNTDQVSQQAVYRAFIDEHIMPTAEANDQSQCTPETLITTLAENGYLDSMIPSTYGGQGINALQYGVLLEQVGRASASLVSLLTVHGMTSQVILKWGSDEQKREWLPLLARGELIAGFALSEPNIGSDASNVETTATAKGDHYVLQGRKKWISFAQRADVFTVIAQCEGKPTAFLVPRNTKGLSVQPIQDMLGFRSAMLGEISMDSCEIPAQNMVGRPGFGFSHIAGTALDHGRYCIAWGSLGMAQCCVDASVSYARERQQFGVPLAQHQLIQKMLADMLTQSKAARLLCHQSAELREMGSPRLIMETSIAKYFVTGVLAKVTTDSIQIHGANGCSSSYPLQRHFRDAKIMEIIEGSDQMQQLMIAAYACQGR